MEGVTGLYVLNSFVSRDKAFSVVSSVTSFSLVGASVAKVRERGLIPAKRGRTADVVLRALREDKDDRRRLMLCRDASMRARRLPRRRRA